MPFNWSCMTLHTDRADSRFAPAKWEASLQSNTASHWLGLTHSSVVWLQVVATLGTTPTCAFDKLLEIGPVCEYTIPVQFMMTSSNGSFSALLALCAGNLPVSGQFPSQRASNADFDVSLMHKLLCTNEWPVIWDYMGRHRNVQEWNGVFYAWYFFHAKDVSHCSCTKT